MENIRMLLAEDDEDDRSFFRQALSESRIGSELTMVTDGWDLIEFLLDQRNTFIPDIIFLDINMPGMDGKSCLREIRRRWLILPGKGLHSLIRRVCLRFHS